MTKKSSTIQRIELPAAGLALYCPFCGAKAVPAGEEWGMEPLNPCQHALFIAHDMEFEFRSNRFDALMNIEGVDGDDIDLPDAGIDGFTDATPLPSAVKFASYEGAPSFYGTYVGFALCDED